MKVISIFLLILGSILLLYGVFSRFYGMPSIAMGQFRSISFLILANIMMTFSLIVLHLNRYFK